MHLLGLILTKGLWMFIKRIVTIGLLMNFLIGAVPNEATENSDPNSGFSSSFPEEVPIGKYPSGI